MFTGLATARHPLRKWVTSTRRPYGPCTTCGRWVAASTTTTRARNEPTDHGYSREKNGIGGSQDFSSRPALGSESKPSLSQWYKLKKHVEKHYYKSRYLLPTRGGNFLNWVSGLRPYIEQRTIREEMRSVLEELVYTKEIKLTGNKLSDAESAKVRKGLAVSMILDSADLDGVDKWFRSFATTIKGKADPVSSQATSASFFFF